MSNRWAEQWAVQGSAKEPYTVSVDFNDNWACSCLGWTRHVPRRDCKHITQIKTYRAYSKEPKRPVSVVVETEPEKKKLYIRSNRKVEL